MPIKIPSHRADNSSEQRGSNGRAGGATETTACLVCGASRARPFLTAHDALLGLPGTFFLVQCCECGLVYQNPRPVEADIGRYYPPEYDPFVPPPWSNPNLLQRMLHLYGLKKRWKLVERRAPQRTGQRSILDVGCATGLFLLAGSAGWHKSGVELSPAAAQAARQYAELTIYEGSFAAVALPERSFDVITMWDVLEHLHQPRPALERVRRLLRTGGILIVRVPNLSAWDARLWGRYWAGLDQPRHIFIPDEAALQRLLSETGFVERERQCLSGSYGVWVLSWRFWLRSHVANQRLQSLARRSFDNLAVRAALLPLLWPVDKLLKKGPLLTIVAQPVE